ncbi:MAG TPA: lipoprotein-releasing ABC transporter permease subunit [Steroidobacteraceae bacterium]|jgi:lipoprotein-releasing system permease protein|nr:lipoprotein-releasing ABC transporter permease subunit [Steroidobacteraceae bacterium]
MFQPFPLFVGLRYVRSRQHKFFVSLITWVSLAGVALGVAALIVVLSVMNGLAGELRERLLALNADARVVDPGLPSADADRALRERLQRLPGVSGVAPFMELTALAVHLPDMVPVLLRGIDPPLEQHIADVTPLLVEGSLSALQPGSNAVVIGRNIADQLGVHTGDAITLLVEMSAPNGTPEPHLRRFRIAGVFEAGIEDDDNAVLARLADVRSFAPLAQGASGLRLRFDDALAVMRYMPAVRAAAPGYLVRDWTQDNASYFRAIRIEKTMMALILLLIVAVAAFNIVAMLVMVVNDKRTDIAILRTIGASPRAVLQAFITQGVAIGWFGVAAGVGLGVLLALNVSSIVPALERLFRFQLFDAQVYYITAIPSELHWHEVGWISAAALLLTLGSTIYPALRAAATPPADALRYE